MADYRICHNTAPHRDDWWTVEKLEPRWPRWLGRWRWETVETWELGLIGRPRRATVCFKTREAAAKWIAEDRKPRTHTCEEA